MILNKLFFGIEMTWKRVIWFALGTAFYSALTLILPFTVHTSFANVGTYLESWILFALIIILNCKTPKDAAIKTFVFFLISQPLIYLLQVPFSYLGWKLFMFYPKWFLLTILTLPGAYIAWYVRTDDLLATVILSIATSFLVYQGVCFIPSFMDNFPKNLLSYIFCISLAFILIFTILKKDKNRAIASIITLFVMFISLIVKY